MRDYHINETDLLMYTFKLIAGGKAQDIQKHIEECPDCAEKTKDFSEMKTELKTLFPLIETPNHMEKIVKEAEDNQPLSLLEMIREFLGNRLPRLQITSALSAVMVLFATGLLLWQLIHKPAGNLCFIKKSGAVTVNRFNIIKDNKVNLNKSIDITLDNGECIFQTKDDKLFVLLPYSKISIDKKASFEVTLHKGSFYSFVDKKKTADKMVITAGPYRFYIVGTKFMVNYEKDKMVKLSVYEGKVKALIDKKETLITSGMTVIKEKGQKISRPLSDDEIKQFAVLNENHIIEHIDDMKFISIAGGFKNARIFENGREIGVTPFMIVQDNRDTARDLTVYKSGFMPKTILVKPGKNTLLDVSLVKPEIKRDNWKIKFSNTLLASPLLNNNNLFIVDIKGLVYNYNLKLNQVKWNFQTGGRITITPVLYKDTLFVFSNDNFIYALNAHKGKLLWKKEVGLLIGTLPVINRDCIYFGNINGELYSLNISDGSQNFKYNLKGGIYSSVYIKNNKLYVGDIKNNFYAFDIIQKRIIWTFKTANRILGTQPFIYNQMVIFGCQDKYLYALKSSTGELIWKFFVNSEIFSSPVRINNTLYLTTDQGNFISLDINKGTLQSIYSVKHTPLTAPLVYNNKYLLVGYNNAIMIFEKNGLLIDQKNLNYKKVSLHDEYLVCWDQRFIYSYKLDF